MASWEILSPMNAVKNPRTIHRMYCTKSGFGFKIRNRYAVIGIVRKKNVLNIIIGLAFFDNLLLVKYSSTLILSVE
jgi:hypothetical protein